MKVKQTISLPHEELVWYREEYPEGSLSATLSLLLTEFRSIHRDVGLTPKRAARDAAKILKEQIDEGQIQEEED